MRTSLETEYLLMAVQEPRNQLDQESSPYLRQHASNPVHWYPWGEEAIDTARALDKPILLSIGYSSCHWCHVMAHESFEDPQVAAVMNTHFINIKVDREERPDLDKIYQMAHQLLTQNTGGWPLTMFLDPHNLLPFFGGTYFPKEPRYQLPGFVDLLLRVEQAYLEQRTTLRDQAEKFQTLFEQISQIAAMPPQLPDADLLQSGAVALSEQYDVAEGGFGQAPKFPMPATLAFVLQRWAYQDKQGRRERELLEMVMFSLTKMARGGIYDHLGGGFCRYAVDRRWMIPHFEKMLYDNGSLLSLYADALALGPDPLFTEAVTGIADWLLRDMQHPQGGFYAALDADSEGEEGKYYLWHRNEIKRLLNADEYLVMETLYGLDKPANFEGRWHLHRFDAWHAVVDRLGLDRAEADQLLASAKAKLLAERQQRIAPGLDNKILASWNALAIKGLVKAGRRLQQPVWIAAASAAVNFIHTQMWQPQQGLYASWCDGQAKLPGYLDDYAYLLEALLVLLSARWHDDDMQLALALADILCQDFADHEQGGFFFTRAPQEDLVLRPKPTLDDALPPGNAVAVRALHSLAHLTGNLAYQETADKALAWARQQMEHYPGAHCSLLSALEAQLQAPSLLIIRCPAVLLTEAETWLAAAQQGYKPWLQAYLIPYEAKTLPAYLPKLVSAEQRSRITAYLCQQQSCSAPITNLDALSAAIS